jgi:hypothetical protein
MRRELGLVAGGSSSVYNCSCATFSPFPICNPGSIQDGTKPWRVSHQ